MWAEPKISSSGQDLGADDIERCRISQDSNCTIYSHLFVQSWQQLQAVTGSWPAVLTKHTSRTSLPVRRLVKEVLFQSSRPPGVWGSSETLTSKRRPRQGDGNTNGSWRRKQGVWALCCMWCRQFGSDNDKFSVPTTNCHCCNHNVRT